MTENETIVTFFYKAVQILAKNSVTSHIKQCGPKLSRISFPGSWEALPPLFTFAIEQSKCLRWNTFGRLLEEPYKIRNKNNKKVEQKL